MSKKDTSIEYAHIYTNNKIGDEHNLSLQVLGDIKKDLDSNNQTFSLVVMVDDYSFPDPSFDYEQFTSWLSAQGFKPDLIFHESQLIPLCDQVLSQTTDQKLKEQLIDYVKSKKYPCSLFIASWYLLRLGFLEHSSFNENFYAKKLINILPKEL